MSDKEFDHKTIMRVRHGPNQGDSFERGMLDAINDTGNFRTRIFTHPDGSITRLKTKGGMPEFITDEVSATLPESTCTLKMDSGVVDLVSATFSGALSDDWGFCHDAVENLGKTKAFLGEFSALLAAEAVRKVRGRIDALIDAVEKAPKSARWRKRSRKGTKRIWYAEVGELQRGV